MAKVAYIDVVTPEEMEERLGAVMQDVRGMVAAIALPPDLSAEVAAVRQDLADLAGRLPPDLSTAVGEIDTRLAAAEKRVNTQGGRLNTIEGKLRTAGM